MRGARSNARLKLGPRRSGTTHRNIAHCNSRNLSGLGVASLHYARPMLGAMEQSVRGKPIGFIPTITQIGRGASRLLFVLGELIERKWLIIAQFSFRGCIGGRSSLAPNATTEIALFLVGFTATVNQQVIPLSVQLTTPQERGSIVGRVMPNIFLGALLSRCNGAHCCSRRTAHHVMA